MTSRSIWLLAIFACSAAPAAPTPGPVGTSTAALTTSPTPPPPASLLSPRPPPAPAPTPSPTPPPAGGLLPYEVPPFPPFAFPSNAVHKNLVADYGAKPDDANDDTAAFRSFVSFARSQSGFALLNIPPGTYLIKPDPVYKVGVKTDGIDGLGMQTIGCDPANIATHAVIRWANGAATDPSKDTKMFSSGVQGAGSTDVRVKCVTFDGNLAGGFKGGEQSHGWDFANSSGVVMESVTFDQIRADGLRFQRGTKNISLRHITFRKQSGRSAIGIQAAVENVRMEDISIDASFKGSDQRLDFEPTGSTSEKGPHKITIVRWIEHSVSGSSEFSFTLSGIPGSNPVTNAQDIVIRDSVILGGVNMRNNRNITIYNTTIDTTKAKAQRCIFINGRTFPELRIENSTLKCDGPAIDARHHGSTGRPSGLRIINSTIEAPQAIYGETFDDIEIMGATLKRFGTKSGDAVFLNGIRQDGTWGADTDLRHIWLTNVRLENFATGLALTGRGKTHYSDVVIRGTGAFGGATPYRVQGVPAQVQVVP